MRMRADATQTQARNAKKTVDQGTVTRTRKNGFVPDIIYLFAESLPIGTIVRASLLYITLLYCTVPVVFPVCHYRTQDCTQHSHISRAISQPSYNNLHNNL